MNPLLINFKTIFNIWQRPTSNLQVIDGIRALSCIWVIGLHAISLLGSYWLPLQQDVQHLSTESFKKLYESGYLRLFLKGDLGVDAFFVISGFLLTYALLREHSKTNKINIIHFFKKRVLRILPIFLFCIGLYCLFAVDNTSNFLPNLLFINNHINFLLRSKHYGK